MNAMQICPNIELFAFILNKFIFLFLCSIVPLKIFSVSSGTYSTPELSKEIISLFFTYKAIQCMPTSAY